MKKLLLSVLFMLIFCGASLADGTAKADGELAGLTVLESKDADAPQSQEASSSKAFACVKTWQDAVLDAFRSKVNIQWNCLNGWTTCLHFARDTYNPALRAVLGNTAYQFSETGTAAKAYAALEAKGRIIKTGDFRMVPVGSIVFWKMSHANGHVALKAGDNEIIGHGNHDIDCRDGQAPITLDQASALGSKAQLLGFLVTPPLGMTFLAPQFSYPKTSSFLPVRSAVPLGSTIKFTALVNYGSDAKAGLQFMDKSVLMQKRNQCSMYNNRIVDVFEYSVAATAFGRLPYRMVIGNQYTGGTIEVR